MPSTDAEPYGLATHAAAVLAARTGVDLHDVAVVLGSGWSRAAAELGDGPSVELADVPGFPAPSVAGHGAAVRSVEIEMVGPSDVTAGGAVTRGREEISQTFGTFLGAWADYRYEVRNLVECGDKVLVESWQTGRGRKSGVEVSESVYVVWTLREGKRFASR